jgi:hypothetical protein
MLLFLELAALAAVGCVVVFVPFTFFMRTLLQRDQAQKLAAHEHHGVYVS